MDTDSPRLRLSIVAVVVLSLFGALFARLWYLQVMVAGQWVIRDGRHPEEERIESQYRETVRALRAAMTGRKHP